MVIEAISSILSGGVLGVIGSAISLYFNGKDKDRDIKILEIKGSQELALREVDERIVTLEFAGRNKIAEDEKITALDLNSSLDYRASISSEPVRYSNPTTMTPLQNWMMLFLDFCRGMIRPGTTIYLLVLTSIIYFMIDPRNSPEEAKQREDVIRTVLSLNATCITWWFGIRPPSQKKKK